MPDRLQWLRDRLTDDHALIGGFIRRMYARIRYAIRHILEGRLGVRVRHAVRFPLRHILCNRLTCSLMCSCRNPSAATFLYMCQTISFSKSSRDAPAALASLIAFSARSSSVGCEAKMRSSSPKHAGTRSRQPIFQAFIILASLSHNLLRLAETE